MALLDTLSVMDVVVSLRTSFHNQEGDQINNSKAMARKYFCSARSKQDLIFLLPLNYLVSHASQKTGMIFMIFKAAKLGRFISFSANTIVRSISRPRSVKFTVLFFNLAYIIYFCSLCLILVTAWDLWLPPLFFELQVGQQVSYNNRFHQFLVAFYYSSANYLGDQDLAPVCYSQLILASLIMIIGLVGNGVLTATVLWITSTKMTRLEKVEDKISHLRSVMKYLNFSGKVCNEISVYFQKTEATRQNQEMINRFMKTLCPSLRKEVMMDTFAQLLFNNETIALCYDSDCHFNEMVERLLRSIQVQFRNPEDKIISLGEESQFFYFLQEGECLVETRASMGNLFHESEKHLYPNEYFGEIGLMLDRPRTASVTALNYCHLGVINKRKFLASLEDFEELKREMMN